MKSLIKNLRTLTIAAIGLAGLAAVPANALPSTYQFTGTFTDGGTATGQITLNQYGFVAQPTSITTTTVGVFSGFTYALPGSPAAQPAPFDYILVLSAGAPSYYSRYLYLDFANSLATGANTDSLIAGSSFECIGFGDTHYNCPANGKIRYFTSGIARVPEPVTLSLFGAGLAGAAMLRRRKKQAQA